MEICHFHILVSDTEPGPAEGREGCWLAHKVLSANFVAKDLSVFSLNFVAARVTPPTKNAYRGVELGTDTRHREVKQATEVSKLGASPDSLASQHERQESSRIASEIPSRHPAITAGAAACLAILCPRLAAPSNAWALLLPLSLLL